MNYKELKNISKCLNSSSFFIFDSNKFRTSYKKLEDTFRRYYKNYNIAYSFKTNYCPTIVNIVKKLGGYAEIVSDFEYEIAIKSGFEKSNVIFNGPVKSLNASIDLLNNGGIVVLDNEEELNSLLKNKHEDLVWNVGIRCNLNMDESKISRFGFDIYSPNFYDVIDKIRSNFNLKLIHCHMGGFRELPYWEKRAKELAVLSRKLKNMPEIIDLGSGMFGEMEESFSSQFNKKISSFDEYARTICTILNTEFSDIDIEKRPLLVTEPGTTIVANALNFYCPITSVKNVRGKDFIEVFGSIHNIGAELAYKKNLPCSLIHSENNTKVVNMKNAEIVGYTCLEYDSLQRDFSGDISIGDYFEFRNVGSYSNVLKPPFIMPNFPMITYENKKIKIIKNKEENVDLYRTYSFNFDN